MLDVEDPNVMNVLIDQCTVESILLIKTREEAQRVITRECPQGARAAFTLDGDQVLQDAHYSNKSGKMGILRESVEAAVREEEARHSALRRALEELQRELEGVRGRMGQDRQRAKEAAGKMKRKTAERRRLEAAMTELVNAQEEEEPEEDIATYVSL